MARNLRMAIQNLYRYNDEVAASDEFTSDQRNSILRKVKNAISDLKHQLDNSIGYRY